MPKTTNAIMMGASGTFGKQVVFKKYADKTVIANVPDFSNRKLTKKQIYNTQTMKRANYYAKGTIEDPKLRDEAQLRLNVQRNKLYTALVKEYYELHYGNDEKAPVQNPVEPLNEPFVNYLLDNSDKSIEEIALLTNSTPGIIAEYKQRRNK